MTIEIAYTYSEMIDGSLTLVPDTIKVKTIVSDPINPMSKIKDLLRDDQTFQSIDYITEIKDPVTYNNGCVPVKECILTIGYNFKIQDYTGTTHSPFRVNTNVEHNLFELVNSRVIKGVEVISIFSVHYSDDIKDFDKLTTVGETTVKKIDLLANVNVVDYGGDKDLISIIIKVDKITNIAIFEEVSKYISLSDSYYAFKNINNIQIIK